MVQPVIGTVPTGSRAACRTWGGITSHRIERWVVVGRRLVRRAGTKRVVVRPPSAGIHVKYDRRVMLRRLRTQAVGWRSTDLRRCMRTQLGALLLVGGPRVEERRWLSRLMQARSLTGIRSAVERQGMVVTPRCPIRQQQ